MKTLIAIVLGLLLGVVVGEVGLRLYNPFVVRLRGDAIYLNPNLKMEFENSRIRGLSAKVIHTTNEIGFRGPNPPKDMPANFTLLAVGGSTTECGYISDGEDWPALLAERLSGSFSSVWMNNAGMDGHSTFGHMVLVRDFVVKLRPKVVFLLVGANDLGVKAENRFDQEAKRPWWSAKGLVRRLAVRSEVINLLLNMHRAWQARNLGLGHGNLDVTNAPRLDVSDTDERAVLDRHKPSLLAYEQRLAAVIQVLQEAGITPILLTQPTLLGGGEATTTDLARVAYAVPLADKMMNGLTYYHVLEAYNDVLRHYAEAHQVMLVDLSRAMPKSVEYFYDALHFTNAGARKVAEVVYGSVCQNLQERFLTFARNPCPVAS